MSKNSKAALSTGEAARLCRISQQSMIRAIDRGEIKGFHVPMSKFRRVPRERLLEFLRAQNMETDDLFREAFSNVLIVSANDQLIDHLSVLLTEGMGFHVIIARDSFQAGNEMARLIPSCIVIDYDNPAIQAASFLKRLKAHPAVSKAPVITLANESVGDAESFSKPFDAVLLAERIRSIAPPP